MGNLFTVTKIRCVAILIISNFYELKLLQKDFSNKKCFCVSLNFIYILEIVSLF